eukprot:34532-Rhodomonas_salina.2
MLIDVANGQRSPSNTSQRTRSRWVKSRHLLSLNKSYTVTHEHDIVNPFVRSKRQEKHDRNRVLAETKTKGGVLTAAGAKQSRTAKGHGGASADTGAHGAQAEAGGREEHKDRITRVYAHTAAHPTPLSRAAALCSGAALSATSAQLRLVLALLPSTRRRKRKRKRKGKEAGAATTHSQRQQQPQKTRVRSSAA